MSPEFVYLIPSSGGLAPDPARFGVMYLTKDFSQKSCNLEGAWNQAIGLTHDNSRTALDNTLRLIEEKLDPYGVTQTTPFRDQPSVWFLHDELHGLKVSATVVPIIFLGVAALVLNILIGRIVAQQRTVIGTLRALGYSTGAILRHYLGFGFVVGAVGGVVGLLFGLWLQNQMVRIYHDYYALPDLEAHLYPNVLLAGLAISIGFALAGTVKGVRYAVQLQPAEAMRPPPPERGGRVLAERIGFIWTRLSFTWKMIVRAVFRNPFRSGVSVAAAFIATALIFGVLSMRSGLDYLMRYEFDKVSHQDITVSLRDPTGSRTPSEVRGLPAVADVEPQLSVTCNLSHGPRRKRTSVTGLPRGNLLCTPLDAEGRPIVVPDEGLVLTRKLAEILDARQGDSIRLRPLIARRQEVEASVVGVIDSFLGLSAYANISYLSRLIGEDWSANLVLANESPGPGQAHLFDGLKERPKVIGITERQRAFSQMRNTLGKTLGTMIGTMVIFSGLIAFGSVLNTALVSLSEREREVGTLRVLGFLPSQVAGIFSGESFLLNGTGILLGLVGGIGFAHLIALPYNTELFRFPVVIYPSHFLVTAALMLAFISAAQVIIGLLIRRLPWLDVLKVKE
ncbi:MAG: ABC transporter permease [Planctomycetes bacterium]|nr:ABC transporter permease [Planctomycetota bacterium]